MNNLNIISLKQTLSSLIETDCIVSENKSKLLQEVNTASSEEQFKNILSSLHENKDRTYKHLSFDEKRNLALENFDKENNDYNKYNIVEQYTKISEYLLREDNYYNAGAYAQPVNISQPYNIENDPRYLKLTPDKQRMVRDNPGLLSRNRPEPPGQGNIYDTIGKGVSNVKDVLWDNPINYWFGGNKSQGPKALKPSGPEANLPDDSGKKYFGDLTWQKIQDRILPTAGILGVTMLIYKLFNMYLSKAAQACSSLKGLDKEECMTNFKIKASEDAVNRLNASIQQCSQSPNALNCSYSLHKQLRVWQDRLAIYQQQSQKIEAKKQEMNLVIKTQEQNIAPTRKPSISRPRRKPSPVLANPVTKPKTFQEPPPFNPTDFGGGGF